MLTKTIISFTLLFCAIICVTSGQSTTKAPVRDPNARPLPSPLAQACIKNLTAVGILDKCHNQSLTLWDPIKRGEGMSSHRDLCCSIYGELDCIMNATLNGNKCNATSSEAMVNHQRTLFGWYKRLACLDIRYHAGQCDPDQVFSK